MYALGFVPGLVLLMIVLFVYLMPAVLVVNHGFGYQTVQGAPPLPLPASSLSSLLIVLATHVALVAAVSGAFLVGGMLLRGAFGKRQV